jgi:hypothetical protein
MNAQTTELHHLLSQAREHGIDLEPHDIEWRKEGDRLVAYIDDMDPEEWFDAMTME